MDLKFIGRGAAFNSKEGNNSSYFIEDKQLFLIDCGESIFERIIDKDLLKNIEIVNIMITHTHSDHIGSIGSLIMYCYYRLNIDVNIILFKGAKHKSNIIKILDSFGCLSDAYKFVDEKIFDNKYKSFNTIRYIETDHCNELYCYGLIFNTNNGIVYYSGDTRESNIIKSLIDSKEKIDKMYIDTTNINIPDNVHLYIGILKDIIPEDLKNRVYCMHLNNDECIKNAIELGFNVANMN